MKKRMVMAGIISAVLYAAAASALTSCDWMELFQNEDETEELTVPMDEVLEVSEVVAGSFLGDTVWVHGFVVGGLQADGTIDFACGEDVMPTALVIADTADGSDPAQCLVLQLTKTSHKQELGPDTRGWDSLLRRSIYVQGKSAIYKKRPAINNICQYKLE